MARMIAPQLPQLPPDPKRFPATASTFMLSGPVGALECIADVAAPAAARRGMAVICHPNPVQGGTMHNKVVTMVEHALRESGLDTLRFNFRGTGASAGSYDDGRGESDDLAAVVDWMRRTHPGDALWLAGFSFGSYVTIRNAQRLGAAALVSIAPPVGRWAEGIDVLPTCPWLVVMGEADEVVEPQAVFDWIAAMAAPPTLVRFAGAGHFFHRRLIELRSAVKTGVAGWLPPTRA